MLNYRVAGLVALAMLTACTTTAPVYTVSVPNIQKLRDSGTSKISVTKVDLPATNQDRMNSIGLRGSTMVSPADGSYAKYLRDALRAEFYEAGRLAEASGIELSGVLTQNDVDAMGFSVGTATLAAQFVVRRDSEVRFDKTLTARHQWESSFAGAIAIPAAINNYPAAVQKLLDALYSDKAFQEAIK